MKSLQRANINALLSSLIWGMIMSLAIKFSVTFLTNQKLLALLQYCGVLLYPILTSIIVRKKTELWLNLCFFSIVGGVASFTSLGFFAAIQNKVWTNIGLLPIFFVVILFLIPKIEPVLQNEWNSPFWEKLNQSSFIEFFSLQFHSLDNNAG
jgi:hypothetical protein